MIQAMARNGNQLPIGKTLLGGGLLLGGLYAVYRISQSSPRHAATPYVGAEVPCMDAALRSDLYRANLWAGASVGSFMRGTAPTAFMILPNDPVRGESAGKPEFAATFKLDPSAILVRGIPLSVYVDSAELTTKVQRARWFSYLGFKFKNQQLITPPIWEAMSEAISDYVMRNTTPISDAMIRQSGWPECP